MSTANVEQASAVTCDDCSKEIKPTDVVHCDSCFDTAVEHDVEESLDDFEDERKSQAPKAIREWAQRRHVMGQISAEVRTELELCADDIDVGHG